MAKMCSSWAKLYTKCWNDSLTCHHGRQFLPWWNNKISDFNPQTSCFNQNLPIMQCCNKGLRSTNTVICWNCFAAILGQVSIEKEIIDLNGTNLVKLMVNKIKNVEAETVKVNKCKGLLEPIPVWGTCWRGGFLDYCAVSLMNH